jgi:3-oxoadipate enol-lactonase
MTTGRGGFFVHRKGSGGRPVVFLHALALSGALWDPVAEFLAPDHLVLAPDARGHGGSDWDGAEFTVEDMAADVAAIIETLDAGPANVVGMSMGGSVALVLAAERPDLVGNLVLADATASYGPDRVEEWAERARRATGVPREQQIKFQHERWFTPFFVDENPAEVARVSDIFLATDSTAHAAACRALGTLDATDRLADVTAETLVIVGRDDFATPPSMSAELASGIPGARFEVLDDTRHLSLIERADWWPVIAEHLSKE